jgi:hypothetical protein
VRLAFALLMLLGAVAGCGPYLSTSALRDADAELALARAAGADRTATYEYAAAEAYLNKAREVAGHSQYEASLELADKATGWARRARKKASGEGTKVQEAR